MNEQSPKYNQKTSKALRSVTSSLGLEGGVRQLDLLDGETTAQCGQVARHANPSAQLANRKEKMMSDTYGQYSSISLESVNLQSSLESKLQAQLGTDGSMIYDMTWKRKVTPQGWSYYQLAASARHTKETDSGQLHGGWATPNTMDYMALRSDEALLRQATTVRNGRTFPANLREQVDPRSQEIYAAKQIPAAWPTPTTRDYKDTGDLSKSMVRKNGKSRLDGVPRVASIVETESTGKSQLNPRFSLWLMGYPIEWGCCGERVTLSSRKPRQK